MWADSTCPLSLNPRFKIHSSALSLLLECIYHRQKQTDKNKIHSAFFCHWCMEFYSHELCHNLMEVAVFLPLGKCTDGYTIFQIPRHTRDTWIFIINIWIVLLSILIALDRHPLLNL